MAVEIVHECEWMTEREPRFHRRGRRPIGERERDREHLHELTQVAMGNSKCVFVVCREAGEMEVWCVR